MNTELKQREENLVIHAVKEFFDVCTPEEALFVLSEKELRSFESSMQSLAFATGPDIVDELSIIERNERIVEKPMNEAIAEGSDSDRPAFTIRNRERSIGSMTIRATDEVGVEASQVPIQVIAEPLVLASATLPFRERLPAPPDSFH